MNADKLKAWLCFKTAPGLGLKTAQRILESYPDPEEFIGQASHPLYPEDWISAKARDAFREGVTTANLEQIGRLMEYYEISYCCLSDPDYPESLKATFSPPLIIYYRGNPERALQGLNLAVVGTRKPSSYGKEMTFKLIKSVAEQGIGIV
ncbi:MAG TPA: DNA-processing protein DprA, partial [Candidatus Cloacimonadota bacterium]|nr:DNA-processing protein DprA [Candidatus Cloacimonadota bacterium]